jgi:hypothetical protein
MIFKRDEELPNVGTVLNQLTAITRALSTFVGAVSRVRS